MSRKPTLLSHLFNLVLRPTAGQTKASSNQLVALPQHPPTHDREAWRTYWQAQGQPWRTEPEIDEKRQEYLAERRTILPDIEHGIYPFKGVKLGRADVEWLLSTHENNRGPVDWSDENQRTREGLDLRGADLSQVDLEHLPLARLCGGLDQSQWFKTTKQQRNMAAVIMREANLREAHLEGAKLRRAFLEDAFLWKAHLEQADLTSSHLEGANLHQAHVEGASLRRAFFDVGSMLYDIFLGNEDMGSVSILDTRWGDVNLSRVKWSQTKMLGDEFEAKQKLHNGCLKDQVTRLVEYQEAVRAYRQLAVALQSQGLNEDTERFAYHAQVLQKRVFWFQMLQQGVKLRQRAQALAAWLFSWFLFLLAGYGYRLWRSFLAYALVIVVFATAYYLLGASFKPSLSLINALGLSMTSFHGRGFFPGVTQLNDTLTILASIEAFVGLILEATFIATLTQRFFGK